MTCGVYVIVSPSNRCYIGSSNNVERRKTTHFRLLTNGEHHCDGLQAAWDKYDGRLIFSLIEECSIDDLINREQWWMDNHSIRWGRMYNSSSIAGRPEHTAEVRKKIAKAQTGRKHTLEHRIKNAEMQRGRKHSDDTKLAISIASSRPENIEKLVQMNRTRERSQGEIDRIRELGHSNRGRVMTDDERKMRSEAQRLRYRNNPMGEDTKRKLSAVKTGAHRRPISKQGLANLQAGAIKRKEIARDQRLREHMDRMAWIYGG